MSVATIVFDQPWILVVLAYGFVARVLTGPTLSPLGQFVTRVLTPRLPFAAEVRARATEAVRAGHRGHALGRRPDPCTSGSARRPRRTFSSR